MSSAGVGIWLYNFFMRHNGDSKTSGIGVAICIAILIFIEFMVFRAIS